MSILKEQGKADQGDTVFRDHSQKKPNLFFLKASIAVITFLTASHYFSV